MEPSFHVVSPAKKGRARLVVLKGGGNEARVSPVPSEPAQGSEARGQSPFSDGQRAREFETNAAPAYALNEPSDDEIFDRLEVPAAVVCARCGEADCLGCDPDEERSGFLTILPWERDGVPVLKRLWLTARVATSEPEGFFEALSDGPLMPALRFAMAAELAAAVSLFGIALGAGALLLPALAARVFGSSDSLGFLLRASFVGLPTVAALLVGAHVFHALALDRAAHKAGARHQRTRALRFGLYAAGWDIVLGPIGLVVMSLTLGPGAALSALRAGGGVPGRASRAFLRGAYGVVGDEAKVALRQTFIGAAVATLLAAIALLAMGTAFVMAIVTRI